MKKLFLTAAFALVAFESSMASASEELARSKNCLMCHSIDNKVIGPAYRDVARKYAGQADAAKPLAEKVIKGGGGVWGTVPMPPNSQVSADEAAALVHWILGLK